MTALMSGHAPIAAEILSRDELLALAGYEETIERGLNTFIEVGIALGQIHDSRLYRAQHDSFEAYCEARWDFTGRRGRQLIEAAAIGTIVPVQNEGQARALAAAPAEERAEVFADATERGGGKPTAKTIDEVVKERKSGPKPDLKPVILTALVGTGRDGLTLDGITDAYGKPAEEKDLRAALDSLTASGEVVVTATWANRKPRRWALPQLKTEPASEAEVLRALATFGEAATAAWQVAFLLDSAQPDETAVTETLERLAGTGAVDPAGRALRGVRMVPLFRIPAPEPQDTQTPGPVEAEAAPSADPGTTPEPATADAPAGVAGSGTTSPEPDQVPAPRPAPRLIAEVTVLVDELVTHPDQVTPEMVAALREQADRLEQVLGGAA